MDHLTQHEQVSLTLISGVSNVGGKRRTGPGGNQDGAAKWG